MPLLIFLLLAVFQTPAALSVDKTSGCAKFHATMAKGSDTKRLKTFFKVQWKYLMNEHPEWATYYGFSGLDDRWTDSSIEAVERRRRERNCQLANLQKVRREHLKAGDQMSFDLALYNLKMAIDADAFDGDVMPISHMDGFHIDGVQTLLANPTESVADYEKILLRLEGFPKQISQTEILMREGLKRKALPAKVLMPKIRAQLHGLAPKEVRDSPLYQFFRDINPKVSALERSRLQAQAREIIANQIYPSLAQFLKFFDKDYAPLGRGEIAWTQLPNGAAWYKHKMRLHTTTDATADELFKLGEKEVARIRGEMEKVRDRVQFRGSLKKFNQYLLKDRQFVFTSAEELLAYARDIAKRVDPELPRLFKTLPRLTYGVRAMQDFQAKSDAAAQYVSGSPISGRAGFLEVNTYDLPSRPKWGFETVTLHEAVPGHHFQYALAQELEGLPDFRKFGDYTAFSEGWALYVETLGPELGLFKDPYSYYGHLSDQMVRAVRLVVDTGMHSKGWSKKRAWDYYREQIPVTDVESENEIDRYIAWPGQALAYKVGQMTIQRLRVEAASSLGDKFDVREFHDQVLNQGALPMKMLENHIRAWRGKDDKTSPH